MFRQKRSRNHYFKVNKTELFNKATDKLYQHLCELVDIYQQCRDLYRYCNSSQSQSDRLIRTSAPISYRSQLTKSYHSLLKKINDLQQSVADIKAAVSEKGTTLPSRKQSYIDSKFQQLLTRIEQMSENMKTGFSLNILLAEKLFSNLDEQFAIAYDADGNLLQCGALAPDDVYGELMDYPLKNVNVSKYQVSEVPLFHQMRRNNKIQKKIPQIDSIPQPNASKFVKYTCS